MARGLQIDALWSGLRGNNGQPLAAGTVTTYIAGTTTPQSVYSDVTCTTPLSNPFTLDANGRKLAYGLGDYKFLIKDSSGATIDTPDNLRYNTYEGWSTWSPNPLGNGTMTLSGVSIAFARYLTFGKLCAVEMSFTATTVAVTTNLVIVSTPVSAAITGGPMYCLIGTPTSYVAGSAYINTSAQIQIRKYDDSNYVAGLHNFTMFGFYEIA